MTLVPYIVLRRGSLVQYAVTLASIPPLMVYVSVSNAPSILKTVFGRREHFKRTPKSRPATTRPTTEKGIERQTLRARLAALRSTRE